jgi:hypothetical protein
MPRPARRRGSAAGLPDSYAQKPRLPRLISSTGEGPVQHESATRREAIEAHMGRARHEDQPRPHEPRHRRPGPQRRPGRRYAGAGVDTTTAVAFGQGWYE